MKLWPKNLKVKKQLNEYAKIKAQGTQDLLEVEVKTREKSKKKKKRSLYPEEEQKKIRLNLDAEKDQEYLRLEKELYQSLIDDRKTEAQSVGEEISKEYPELLEFYEAVFGFYQLLHKQSQYEKRKHDISKVTYNEYCNDFTEYQFLISHFIVANSLDKKFLKRFWNFFEKYCQVHNLQETLDRLRKGILTEIAADKTITKILGVAPTKSKPKEDKLKAVDMWMNSTMPVQVATGAYPVLIIDETLYIQSEKDNFRKVLIDEIDLNEDLVISRYVEKYLEFNRKIHYGAPEWWAKKIRNKHIVGSLFVINFNQIDLINGDPSEQMVKFFRQFKELMTRKYHLQKLKEAEEKEAEQEAA